MTTAVAETPRSQSAPPRGLRVPAWLNPLTPWLRMNLAVPPVLREAKALLYIELAEAAGRGVPLDKALEMCARTSAEMDRSATLTRTPRGADTRWLGLAVLTLAGAFCAAIVGMNVTHAPDENNPYAVFVPILTIAVLMAATGMRFADTERVARKLAISLGPALAGGASLSAAMARRSAFDAAEARLVEAGERGGRLPEALARLGWFQGAEARAAKAKDAVCYPVWLFLLMVSILAFTVTTIYPKFTDIYAQLGAEMAPFTTKVMGYGGMFRDRPRGSLLLVWLAVLVFQTRLYMNGTAFAKLLFMLPWFAMLLGRNIAAFASDGPGLIDSMGLSSALEWWTGNSAAAFRNSPFWASVAAGLLVFDTILHFAFLGYMMRGIEWLILRAEGGLAALTSWVPVIGAAAAARGEARWMGALALGLGGAGMGSGTAGDALRMAGGVSGGWRGGASVRSARLADAGVPLGEAVGRTGAASAYVAARLTLMEGRPDFADALRGLADDRAAAAAETGERLARVGECVAVTGLGVVTGLFAVALYTPLFELVRAVAP